MPDVTPDRLKAFRAQYDDADRRHGAFSKLSLGVMIVGFAAVIAMEVYLSRREPAAPPSEAGMSPQEQRDFAAYLASKNHSAAALDVYDEYLSSAKLDPPARATVCYSMAKLAIDVEQFDRALTYLYEAEMLDATSELQADIDKKIVLCLDKLGRSEGLRRELAERSDLSKRGKVDEAGEIVLAEFGDEVVTNLDLERAIEQLPASARGALDSPESKADFLKNMVAERLLVDQARRLELDKTPQIQEELARELDALIVRKLIDDEVRAKMQVTPQDVERFYKAEIARFTIPATAQGRVAEGVDEAEAQANAKLDTAKKAVVRDESVAGSTFPQEANTALAQAVMASEPGTVTVAVESGTKWYAFEGKLDAERIQPFEDVKEEASRLYSMSKEQEEVAALVNRTLEARNVKLHVDRIAEGAVK